MPKLAHAAALAAVIVAMSLGGTAHAQESEEPSQPAGVIQQEPAPPQPQPPDDPPAQDQDPTQDQDPDPPETTTTTSARTTTTAPPAPRSLPVRVPPNAGSPGTTVKVSADLHGCARPASAEGFFEEVHEWGVDALAKPLVWERVAGGRWYSAQYLVTKRDPVGLGRFGVICDNGRPNFSIGFATFRVQKPSSSPVSVRLSPRAGGPGTRVEFTADTPGCDKLSVGLHDRKGRADRSAERLVWDVGARRISGHFTVAKRAAAGQLRLVVVCYLGHDPVYDGSASFQVRAAQGGSGAGDDQTANRNDDTQLPNRIDTGQGGTADDGGHGGLNSAGLLLAGLVLIALAVGLRLGRSSATRPR